MKTFFIKMLPTVALAAVALGYTAAVADLNAGFESPRAALAVHAAADLGQLAVHDVMAGAEQPMDAPHCAAHDAVATYLGRDYDEVRVGTSRTDGGLELDLWGGAGTGTWTLVHRADDGISCIVSSGTGWTAGTTQSAILETAGLAQS